jgi:hypothetical protein
MSAPHIPLAIAAIAGVAFVALLAHLSAWLHRRRR